MLFGGLRKCAIQSSFSQALDFKKKAESGEERGMHFAGLK